MEEKRAQDYESHMSSGQRAMNKVQAMLKKPVSILLDFTFPKTRVKEIDKAIKVYRCCMCGATYGAQKGNFYMSNSSPLWKGNNGFLPFCKSCCDTLMDTYTHLYNENEEHALRHLCQMFDWYYSPMASAMTLNQVQKGGSRLTLYPSKLVTRQVSTKGETFIDTLKDEQVQRDKLTDTVSVKEDSKPENEPEFLVTKQMVRVWGTGYTPVQYEFLETEYEDWTNRTEVESKSQEELIRNICIAQLNIRVAQATGGKTDAAQKALTDLMTNCNLTPRQKNEIANRTETQLSYGQFIKRIENERPIGEPLAEFKDPDGIKKYINTFFFGHLAKALGIKNDNQAAYEAEMDKYKGYSETSAQKEISADEVFGAGSEEVPNEENETTGGDDQ